MSLCAEPLWSTPPRAERLETKRRLLVTYVRTPFIASSVFAFCFSKSIRAVIASMPDSARTPGDQLLRFADEMWLWTYCSGLALAFVGIHAFAVVNKAFTASVWRLFALVSPAGEVPRLPWFVRQASSACVWVALGILAVALLFPFLRRGAAPVALETLIHDHASSLLVIMMLLLVLRRMRDRSLAIVNRDIWGGPTRATLALLTKVAVLLATLELFVLANRMLLRSTP